MPTPEKPHGSRARIEIIPLIDVIFFLLATFVLFTLSLNKIQSLPLELPTVPPPPVPPMECLTIQVSSPGTLVWDRETITREELPARLASLRRTRPDPRVLVSGDRNARFGSAVEVLDQVRLAGIAKVSVKTDNR